VIDAQTGWRLLVPIVGFIAIGLFAFLYHVHPHVYFAILTGWGLEPFRFPFLDTHAVLSALECTRRGFDVYRYNPCDVLTRAFVYSPMILDASFLKVTPGWLDWTGFGLAAGFFLSLASLPTPRAVREWIVMALAICSTMSLYALERGNIDLLMFALVVVAGHFMQRGRAARAISYGAILFGICLKYYPIVGLIVALRERPRRFLAIVAAGIVVLALFVLHYHAGLAEAMTRVPHGSYFTDFFGAVNLPFGLAELLSPAASDGATGALIVAMVPWILLALLIGSGFRQATGIAGALPSPDLLSPARTTFLILGAAIIVGCFFAGQSIDYRGIFFLLILPGLLTLSRQVDAGHILRRLPLMIIFLMWGEMFFEVLRNITFADPIAMRGLEILRVVFWFVRELIWWRVITALAGILLGFVATSEMAQRTASLLRLPMRVPR
jgi:hypothetical protein